MLQVMKDKDKDETASPPRLRRTGSSRTVIHYKNTTLSYKKNRSGCSPHYKHMFPRFFKLCSVLEVNLKNICTLEGASEKILCKCTTFFQRN